MNYLKLAEKIYYKTYKSKLPLRRKQLEYNRVINLVETHVHKEYFNNKKLSEKEFEKLQTIVNSILKNKFGFTIKE